MMRLLKLLTVAVAFSCMASANATVINFSFSDSLADAGTPTPLTVSAGGVDANFSSSPDANGFFVLLNTGTSFSFSENVLISESAESLDITFSQPLSSFTADFATETAAFAFDGTPPGPSDTGTLDLTALSGGLTGTTVGSTSATATTVADDSALAGYTFPEGTISFSGATFDSLILSDSSDPAFALGSFQVTTAPQTSVPEPAPLALFGAGLAALALIGYRRRRRL
jgi:hypothetical protein